MASVINVHKEEIMARFGGMGFHNTEAGLYRRMSDRQFSEVVGKVFHELSPGFSRMWGGSPFWTKKDMDDFAEYCEKTHCKTGTTIYLTGNAVRYHTDEEFTQYAKNVADRLEYLKANGKPFTIKTEDYLLRSGGVMNDDGTFSVAIVNRHREETELEVVLDNFRRIRRFACTSTIPPMFPAANLLSSRSPANCSAPTATAWQEASTKWYP